MSSWIIRHANTEYYFLGFAAGIPIWDADQLYLVPDFQQLLLVRASIVSVTNQPFTMERIHFDHNRRRQGNRKPIDRTTGVTNVELYIHGLVDEAGEWLDIDTGHVGEITQDWGDYEDAGNL